MDIWTQKKWLPYLVGLTGIVLSVLAWFILLVNIQAYLRLLSDTRHYLPWVVLFLGITIFSLIAALIRINLIAQQQARSLHKSNESLKKEIEDKLNLEESKQKLEVALLQGQKLQAMGTLASGIAHDFNNILYAIIGYTELTREDVEKDSIPFKNLGKVLEASHRGQELVSRILAFSRRQHHTFDVIDLKTTIEAALSLLRPTIPASVIIEYQAYSHCKISGNQTQIHQVLVNLINNAVDAMDGEGRILIETNSVAENDPVMKHFPAKPGVHYCKIEISDTGHGMDQHTIERVFDPFFTTKEVGKGTGLGLSIVHSIVEEHQGKITVKSQLGQGTTMMILLPTVQAALQGD